MFSDDNNTTDKKINIIGTSNRYQINKLKKNPSIIKKRKETEKWGLPIEYFDENMQKSIIQNMYNYIVLENQNTCDKYNIISSQLDKKISGYKQQDIDKKRVDIDNFVTLKNVVTKLHDCDLKCYYCKDNIFILYEVVREHKQWTLDRINNDLGHTNENVLISCLSCNLKRRRTNKDSFLFTKQLQIIKNDY